MTTVKTKVIACFAGLLLLGLAACAQPPLDLDANRAELPTPSPYGDAPTPGYPNYAVYQQFGLADAPDQFSLVMINNPIDARMASDPTWQNLTTPGDYAAFYSAYLNLWKAELAFSVLQLKTYLTEEEGAKLDQAQQDWVASVNANRELDAMVIDNNELLLGEYYGVSAVLHSLRLHQERVFHIKYLTYLVENFTPERDQLWDNFHT